ncbi:hypothetical protein Tco_0593707 [Tanacetum coccineum]
MWNVENDVEVVFDETTNLMASMRFKGGSDKGYGINSLLKQWRETKRDDDYDPYDDDLFERKKPLFRVHCGLEKVAESGVKLSCINCFLKKGLLYRFKYQASIEFLYAKARGGTCSMAKSDPLEDYIWIALIKEESGRVANLRKTVRPTRHAKKDKDMIESVTRIATSIPRSFSKRENKDLGHRNDVVKVPVEELSSFRRSLNQ